MGTGSGIYRFFLLLHITAVVVGFGPLMLAGIYGRLAQTRGGGEGLAISEANEKVNLVAEKVIYTVPLFGIALMLLSDDTWAFDQLWISLSLLLYVIVVLLARLVMIPSHRRVNELSAELLAPGPGPDAGAGRRPPQLAQLEQLGKKLAVFGGIMNLIVIVVVGLMIWKPGA